MFEQLIASGDGHAPRSPYSILFSVTAHLAIIGVVTAAGGPAVRLATAFETHLAVFLFPAQRGATSSDPTAEAGATMGDGTAGVRASTGSTNVRTDGVASPTASSVAHPPAPDTLTNERTEAEAAHAFIVLDVDTAAVRDPTSKAPAYPHELEERHIEGLVRVRFVVDSTGLIYLTTVNVVESTHAAFLRAVLDAMPGMHFRPARMGATPVRQLSQQDFRFRLAPTSATHAETVQRPPTL